MSHTKELIAERFPSEEARAEYLTTAMRQLLFGLGADLDDPGLVKTPARAAKYWLELTEGMKYTNAEIADMYDVCFDAPSEAMVVERDITIFSHCEHHTALMYDMKVAVAYLPKDKVIGLRQDIYEVLHLILETDDIYIRIEGKHGCMTARGVKSYNSTTCCQGIHGRFETEPELRQEAITLMNGV